MNDNIIDIPNLQQDQLQGSIELLKRNMQSWVDYGRQIARIRRAHYEAYIAEGFTPEQALILCQKFIL